VKRSGFLGWKRLAGVAVAGSGLAVTTLALLPGQAGAAVVRTGEKPGGVPAGASCGLGGLGQYVKFTLPGGDGASITANVTSGQTATANVNQAAAPITNTQFQVNSSTLNGVPAVIYEVGLSAANDTPYWLFTANPQLSSTVVLEVGSKKNFTQMWLCMAEGRPFSLTKTVDVGSGSFTFDVVCKAPDNTVVAGPTAVVLAASAGSPATQQIFANVPVGATCTATETASVPTNYANDGPKNTTIATGVSGSVTINNTRVVDNLSITKTLNPDPLPVVANPGPPSAATFTITVTNSGTRAATNVVVTDVVPGALTVGTVTPSAGTWVAPTWTVGSIAAGTAVTLTMEVLVPSDVGTIYPIPATNCAAVTFAEIAFDVSTIDNDDCVTITRV
jgi:uncharacterized repeat protein (TIGR01451 family)